MTHHRYAAGELNRLHQSSEPDEYSNLQRFRAQFAGVRAEGENQLLNYYVTVGTSFIPGGGALVGKLGGAVFARMGGTALSTIGGKAIARVGGRAVNREMKSGINFEQAKKLYWVKSTKQGLAPLLSKNGQVWKQYLELHQRFIPQRFAKWVPNRTINSQ